MIHSLELKRKVLDVRARVFKRRSTVESVPSGDKPSNPQTPVDDGSSLKKAPSVISLASKRSRTSQLKEAFGGRQCSEQGDVVRGRNVAEAVENDNHLKAKPMVIETTTAVTIERETGIPNANNCNQLKDVVHRENPDAAGGASPRPTTSSSSPQIEHCVQLFPQQLHQQNHFPDFSSHSAALYKDQIFIDGSLESVDPSSPIPAGDNSLTNLVTSQPPTLPESDKHSPLSKAASSTAPSPASPIATISTPARFNSARSDRSAITISRIPSSPRRPSQIARRQSLFPATESTLIRDLLDPDRRPPPEEVDTPSGTHPAAEVMAAHKVWVKRPNASPTAVTISELEIVDDVREAILIKYHNTLGRFYDAPDILLRIIPRGNSRSRSLLERILNPDEIAVRLMDEYYPGGQAADEALVIEVPQRRTPPARPSPNHTQSYTYGSEPVHVPVEGQDYFSHPVGSGHSQGTPGGGSTQHLGQAPINQVSQIPGSPGRRPQHRPTMRPRMNTSSPTLQNPQVGASLGGPVVMMPRGAGRSRGGSDASNGGQPQSIPPSNPTTSEESGQKLNLPSPIRAGSPTTSAKSFKKEKKQAPGSPAQAPIHTDGAVPPIKVLIVEDNVINLRLLEAFMKRLKVRWEAAMNGKIAVDKWRAGGFHLVLMDIQLPVMSGLEATKEIRRLEKVNRIGAFPHTKPCDDNEPVPNDVPDADRLPDSILFRSPVIIVALTASSLQSDRHEAYAAGCNDFLTKPVNFIWLERKVTEWGCMQALIDFDGWRKWKDAAESQAQAEAAKTAKNKRMVGGSKAGGKKAKNFDSLSQTSFIA